MNRVKEEQGKNLLAEDIPAKSLLAKETTVKDLLERMTLEDKIGQLFTFYYKSTDYSDHAEAFIAGSKAGGMFLDMECLETPEQVHRLTSCMQRAALERGAGIPLFIAADLVAGAGCKLSGGGAVHFPKNMAVGAANDEILAYESGRITAMESLAMGVNFNYSPVADINNNPANPVIGTHSFGSSSDGVSRMAAAVIRGYQEHGMIATAKHFPGHGDTDVDSHLDLPVLPFDRDRLEEFELVPFREAIAAGTSAVMVGHIAVPSLDPSMLPASLSRPMVTGLLRERMAYDGLIVTDGLSMKGVTAAYSQVRACVMALQAGADILLVEETQPGEGRAMVEAVLEAVRSGELEEDRITVSVQRILRTKGGYGLLPGYFSLCPFDPSGLAREDSERISLELARKALRIHGPAERWAAAEAFWNRRGGWRLVADRSLAEFADRIEDRARLAGRPPAGSVRIDGHETLMEWFDHEGETTEAVLIALTHNKRMRQDVLERLEQFAAGRREPVILVHFGSPFDAEWFPDTPALLMYDRAPSLQRAAAEYITEFLNRERGE